MFTNFTMISLLTKPLKSNVSLRQSEALCGLNKVVYLLENNQSVYGEDYVIMQNGKPLQYVDGNFYNIKDKGLQQPINLVNIEASNHASSYLYILA